MKEIKGNYTNAIVYTDNMEEYAEAQIKMLCDNKCFEDSKIRIMPDVHPGKVGPIGFTAFIKRSDNAKIMPSIVGVDIGCGMTICKLAKVKHIEFQKLDKVIRENVPSGFKIRNCPSSYITEVLSEHIVKPKNVYIKDDVFINSLGTLGGGNHFIEIDKGDDGYYLVVHSGSRNLGVQVESWYTNAGQEYLKHHKGITDVPFELTYLEGNLLKDYMTDVAITQFYASLNRSIIIYEILKGMKWKSEYQYECKHNYIHHTADGYIIRKGSISATKDEKVIIPINMRDGVILGRGLGNPEWNYSAPHGAGRLYSRSEVKEKFTVSEYKKAMKGIYSSCIDSSTLDEAPFVYRNIDEIVENIKDTVEIDTILKPVYNFKAGR